jgi:adenine-specific DNA-methyltransferase
MARTPKKVDALKHAKARRINVPTAELQSLAEQQEEMQPLPPRHFQRARPLAQGETRERDPDLDPQIVWNGVRISLTKEQVAQLNETGTVEIGDAQLVWRGKDRQDWSDLVVNAPMLYVQEKVHPKQIIDDLKRQTDAAREPASDTPDLFADFNGLTDPEARAEFYQHAMYWQNRMILGSGCARIMTASDRHRPGWSASAAHLESKAPLLRSVLNFLPGKWTGLRPRSWPRRRAPVARYAKSARPCRRA